MFIRPTTWPARRTSELEMSELPNRYDPLANVLRASIARSRRRINYLNWIAALTFALALAIVIYEAISI